MVKSWRASELLTTDRRSTGLERRAKRGRCADLVSQMLGKSVINEGKVEGDSISFSINANFQGNEMKLTYKGKIAGDTIKLSSEFGGGGQTIEWTLKKAS